MSTEALPITFISVNWASTFEMGYLVVPREFIHEYGPSLPVKVIVNVPSGVSWPATFDIKNGIVGGLQAMIKEYGLNRCNLPVMQYHGGGNFQLRIFNCYAVEIEYNAKENLLVTENCSVPSTNYLNMQEIELHKLEVAFKFNVCNNNVKKCEVKIDSNHLSTEANSQILSTTHIRELELDKTKNYIYVGFASKSWKIEFEKLHDNILLGHGWNEFAKSCGLSVGDICCFQKTHIQNSFQVAIYHLREMRNLKLKTGRSRTCFLHMTNEHSLSKAEIVMPRMFAKMYGRKLESIVSLWMADNNIWITSFRKKDNCLFSLQRLQKYYSIEPKSYIVFQYFGKSTFYISILRPDGYDILNRIRTKMLVSDVVMEDDSMNTISFAESMCEEEGHPTMLSTHNAESSGAAEQQRFTVVLTSCHFDDRCHGVYIPRSLTTFYDTWKPTLSVTLRYETEEWEVKGNLSGKRCRLGKGWSDFISDTPFIVGQKITFCYMGSSNLVFEIMV